MVGADGKVLPQEITLWILMEPLSPNDFVMSANTYVYIPFNTIQTMLCVGPTQQ